MKKADILKYFKIGTILFFDAVWAWIICTIPPETDFVGFGLMLMFGFLVVFNIWAFIIYSLTKLICIVWLRETAFYLLLLLFLCAPNILGVW